MSQNTQNYSHRWPAMFVDMLPCIGMLRYVSEFLSLFIAFKFRNKPSDMSELSKMSKNIQRHLYRWATMLINIFTRIDDWLTTYSMTIEPFLNIMSSMSFSLTPNSFALSVGIPRIKRWQGPFSISCHIRLLLSIPIHSQLISTYYVFIEDRALPQSHAK